MLPAFSCHGRQPHAAAEHAGMASLPLVQWAMPMQASKPVPTVEHGRVQGNAMP